MRELNRKLFYCYEMDVAVTKVDTCDLDDTTNEYADATLVEVTSVVFEPKEKMSEVSHFAHEEEHLPNLVSSLCQDGTHAPVIDLDVPVSLVPSSTPGHSHLYIDHPMSWEDFKSILSALVKAGIVEEGYYKAALKRGFTSVRPSGVLKRNVPQSIAEVILENQKMAQENFWLRQQFVKMERELKEMKQALKDAQDEAYVLQHSYTY